MCKVRLQSPCTNLGCTSTIAIAAAEAHLYDRLGDHMRSNLAPVSVVHLDSLYEPTVLIFTPRLPLVRAVVSLAPTMPLRFAGIGVPGVGVVGVPRLAVGCLGWLGWLVGTHREMMQAVRANVLLCTSTAAVSGGGWQEQGRGLGMSHTMMHPGQVVHGLASSSTLRDLLQVQGAPPPPHYEGATVHR